ncbi:hypothetical protein PIB30_091801, partial [Stylosanthes scabra]|nr:hypothetical protein [Stylosanthes scabra]
MARPHDLRLPKIFTTGATVCPHASRVRTMDLARPRGELGHIRPKLNKCVARSRLLLARAHGRASARWPWRVRALALDALEPTIGRTA